ncbi:integrase, catalytic region, zinc finger, CCHC-type containing protein [Tanacetum coccineum]
MNYLEEQTDGEAMINSIQNGDHPLPVIAQVSLAGTAPNAHPTLKDPQFWTAEEKKNRKIDRLARSLLIQGLPNDIYSLIDSNDTAKDLWDALERQMRGSEYGEQDRKAAILYEYETFKATEGEQLLDTYLRYLQVINDLKKCGYKKDNCELNYKFLNNLQPEWKQYGTLMRQTKNLMDINIDALYNILKQNQGDTARKAKVKTTTTTRTKMLLAKKDSDEQVLLAEDQAWMESSSDSDQVINANMLFMAKMEKVLSDSEEKYYDHSTNYGLFMDNDDDQEIFHDAIKFASENFIENHIVSQTDHDQSKVDHNDSEENDHLVDKLIKKFNQKIAKSKYLRPSLYDEEGYWYREYSMFLTHWIKLLEIEKFKSARENKIEFVYDYGNLNESYVNEKIIFSDDYFQEIINLDFEKIDSPFQQTSSLKLYVPTVILEKIIIDLEDEVVSLLEKEKENLEIIESLKSKGSESSESAIFESENQNENDCHVVEKGCSKHMTGNRALLTNFVEKFLGTVRFGNNDFVVIAGYGDFCDMGLEVAFLKSLHVLFETKTVWICLPVIVRRIAYTIALNEIASNSSACLLVKAYSSQSWLWHQRLSYLNFAIINNLVKSNLVQGLPKMKFEKDRLCSACEQGKIHRKHHKVNNDFCFKCLSHFIFFIDLCGPMRLKVLKDSECGVVVDDYYRCVSERLMVLSLRNHKCLLNSLTRCYLFNDYDDVGKLKEKGDIGVFVGYSKESAAFRVYNKRTRKIHESVNVNFDEISEIASKQFRLEPGLSNLNKTGKSSNSNGFHEFLGNFKEDLEEFIYNFYDEYF